MTPLLRSVPCLLLLALLAGCLQMKPRPDDQPQRPAHWRPEAEATRTGSLVDAFLARSDTSILPREDPVAFYRRNWLLWRGDHRDLVKAVGRNALGVSDTAARLEASLAGMQAVLQPGPRRDGLDEIAARYRSIAGKSAGAPNPRAFDLALDRIRWRMEKEYDPASEGLLFVPPGWWERDERALEESERTEPAY